MVQWKITPNERFTKMTFGNKHMGHEKTPPYFPLYWWFNDGILNMVCCNPHLAVQYNPLYTLDNQNNKDFFIAHLVYGRS